MPWIKTERDPFDVLAVATSIVLRVALSIALPTMSSQTAVAAPAERTVTLYESGNDLWGLCGEVTSGPSPGGCTSYIAGASDGISWSPITQFCPSPGVTAGQVADVVRQYLWSHPERRNHAAVELVGNALKTAFPCPKH